MFKLLVAVAVVWAVLLPPLEYPVTHQWASPVLRALYMTWHDLSRIPTMGSSDSRYFDVAAPWVWLIRPLGLAYLETPRYLSAVGWTVWALVVPSMAYLAYEAVSRQPAGRNVTLFGLSWFVAVYGLLIPIELLTRRLMYTFYFYPAVPAVCLAIAWGAWKLWTAARKGSRTRVAFLAGTTIYLLMTIATFIIMSPIGTSLVKLPA
jgi:dolichyl-phosphate-mannose--protein O-mannosyl transferase